MAAVSAGDLIRRAIEQLRAAARHERIEPDGDLGAWNASQEQVLLAMAHLVDEYRADMTALISRLDTALGKEVARLNAQTDEVKIRAEEARQITAGLRHQVQAGEIATIGALSRDIAHQVKEVAAARQCRWDRRQDCLVAGVCGLVGVALFVIGAFAQVLESEPAVRAVNRCLANVIRDTTTGELFCDIDTMMAGGRGAVGHGP